MKGYILHKLPRVTFIKDNIAQSILKPYQLHVHNNAAQTNTHIKCSVYQ